MGETTEPTIEEIEPFPLDGPPVETKAQEPKIEKSELSSKIERLRDVLKKWENSPNSVPERYKEKIEEMLKELEENR